MVASDQVAVNSAQDAVNSAQAALDSVNTITLPSGYVSAFKGNVAGTVSSSELEAVAKPGVAMNTYKDNVVAGKEVVSTNGADVSLTSEQEKQLTLFIAELVNSVRNQVGSSAVKVTEGSLAYAKTIIKGYNATGTQPVTHNSKVIVNAEKLYNVNSGEDLSLFFGDDSTPLTMNDIFGRVYNGLVGMLFNDADSNWGHTYSILGQNPQGISFGQEYLGVDSDQWGDTQYEFIGLNSTTTNNDFNTSNEFSIPNTTETHQQALHKAKSALANAENQLATDQAKLTSANQALANANEAVAQAKTTADNAKATLTDAQTKQSLANADVTAKQSEADQANSALATANQNVATAQVALENLSADQATKLANLQSSKDALTSAQAELAKRQATDASAQDALK